MQKLIALALTLSVLLCLTACQIVNGATAPTGSAPQETHGTPAPTDHVTEPEATTESTVPTDTAPENTESPEPTATEPPATESPATEPVATEPPATESPATEPVATEPPATESPATEPVATEPPATEPPATKPAATEPPATEHKHAYASTVVAPTCTAQGYTLDVCACGGENVRDITNAKGHAWGEWVVVTEPTYTACGTAEQTCGSCGAKQSQTVDKLVTAPGEMQREVLRLVNIEREKAGLAPLEYLTAGQAAADVRAAEIRELFGHTRPDGSRCFTVLQEYDITFYAAGENIAYGYTTPEAVVEAWMNSDGHRANILNPEFTALAVGMDDNHWVQLFIRV